MKYGYFPGCSLERNAAAYHMSALAVTKPLDIEFVEVDDWNCCGATEYVSLNLVASYALIARNLAQATKLATEGDGGERLKELVAPCSACYLNLRKCDAYMHEDAKLAHLVNEALAAGGLAYTAGSIRVRHLLDVIVNDIGCDAITKKVVKPLHGLRLAPYYGCFIVRPQLPGQPVLDSPEYPTVLDKLLKCLGAEVIDFPMKAHCCGGHMTQISEAAGFEMIRRIVKGAADYHADMIVALCPMCQLNLDAFQNAMNAHFSTDYHVPVLYFTQAMGLAFGMDAASLGIGTELVDARPALSRIGVEVPPPAEEPAKPAPKPRKPKEALPMPRMPGEEEAKQ